MALSLQAQGCFYSSYTFRTDASRQTTARKLLSGLYREEELSPKRMSFLETEFERLEREKAARQTDPDFVDDYAYLLFMTGDRAEAMKLWNQLLQADPNRFSTLCNVATALQMSGKNAEAMAYLKRAVQAKPGFRSGAEEYHLEMLDYAHRQRLNPAHGEEHLFVDRLTSAWMERKEPPAFREAKLAGVQTDGIAELLRQFPNYGDAWLVLGMLLERDGEYHDALLAYQRALRFGNGQKLQLDSYMRLYRAFEERQSPARRAGWMFLLFLVLVFGFLILTRVLGVVRAVASDRSEARRYERQRRLK